MVQRVDLDCQWFGDALKALEWCWNVIELLHLGIKLEGCSRALAWIRVLSCQLILHRSRDGDLAGELHVMFEMDG